MRKNMRKDMPTNDIQNTESSDFDKRMEAIEEIQDDFLYLYEKAKLYKEKVGDDLTLLEIINLIK